MRVKIVALLIVILSIVCIFTACAPKNVTPSETNVTNIVETTVEEESTEVESTVITKENCVRITGMKLDVDSRGDKIVIIGYSWTNIKEKAVSFMLTFEDYVYQNGLECENAYFANDTSADRVASVLPGSTIEFTKAYLLRDDKSDILVIVKDWIGDTVYIELNFPMTELIN